MFQIIIKFKKFYLMFFVFLTMLSSYIMFDTKCFFYTEFLFPFFINHILLFQQYHFNTNIYLHLWKYKNMVFILQTIKMNIHPILNEPFLIK